jgi:hypothetical protein
LPPTQLRFRDLNPGDVFRMVDGGTVLLKTIEQWNEKYLLVNTVNVETGELDDTDEESEVRKLRGTYVEEQLCE